MIIIYAVIVLLLGAGATFARLRRRNLERKYVRAAGAADKVARDLTLRGGNNQPDPMKAAKRQLELGRLVEYRDRVEVKHDAWEARSETLGRVKRRLLGYRGRLAPYAFGVVDLLGVFALLTMAKVIDPSHLQVALQSARMLVAK